MSSKTFTKSLSRFVKVAEGNADKAVRRIGLGLLANVVTGSPVDTGRFRGNWQVGLGTRPAKALENVSDETGQAVMAEATKSLADVKAGGLIFLTNNLPYSLALEYGHSQQAPHGMVRLAFRRLKEIVGDAVKDDGKGGT